MAGSTTSGSTADFTSLGDSRSMKANKDGVIPLVENIEYDPEETALRDAKEREAKRKREEDSRQRKLAPEQDEVVRVAKVKDENKNKPFTFDSNGNIIWVQSLHAEKLPNSANPIPHYVLSRETVSMEDRSGTGRQVSSSLRSGKVMIKTPKAKTKDIEMAEPFKKFNAQQPPMMDVMKMSPGVQLNERGKTKSGESADFGDQARAPMSRQQYAAVVKKEGYPAVKDVVDADAPVQRALSKDGAPAVDSLEIPSQPAGQASLAGNSRASPQGSAAPSRQVSAASKASPQGSRPPSRQVSADGNPRIGADAVGEPSLVPRPPSTPRSAGQSAVPLPSFRRVQKRDALGFFAQSARERVSTGGGSRFPACAAPPLLGATMGHGLIPQNYKYEEYYFPDSVSPGLIFGSDGEGSPPPSGRTSALGSPRAPDGNIISKNQQLYRRLFNS
jgi:hypothetical protein